MSDYLIHYGVKGMKWGVRKERSTSTGGDKKKRGLSTGQKVALGVAAVAITGSVLYKTGSFDRIAAAGRRAANRHKADKLGLELVQNSEKPSSNFDKAMSRMNEAVNAGGKYMPSNYSAVSTRAKNSQTSATKKLSDFTFERLQRVDANGRVSTIDLPTDRKGYADAFAKRMSKKPGDYDYWYKYIMGRMNA